MFNQIYLSRISDTSVVQLDRPQRLNVLDLPMWQELGDDIESIQKHPQLRCIVLRGGGGNFAAGADLGEFLYRAVHPG